MLKPSTPECPQCESRHVTPVNATTSDDTTYWIQCECCDHVFTADPQSPDWIPVEESRDPVGFSDLAWDEPWHISALVERYRVAHRAM